MRYSSTFIGCKLALTRILKSKKESAHLVLGIQMHALRFFEVFDISNCSPEMLAMNSSFHDKSEFI